MRRIDYWKLREGLYTHVFVAGIGLFNGKLQCVEGDRRRAEILLNSPPKVFSTPEYPFESVDSKKDPEVWLNNIQYFSVTAPTTTSISDPYDDDDANYDPKTGYWRDPQSSQYLTDEELVGMTSEELREMISHSSIPKHSKGEDLTGHGTREYVEQSELTRYIWHSFRQLLTRDEELADNAFAVEFKFGGRADEPIDRHRYPRLLSERRRYWKNTYVMEMLRLGYGRFQANVRERIVREKPDSFFVNRCPACQRIVASSKAKQCLWCGNDWHPSP